MQFKQRSSSAINQVPFLIDTFVKIALKLPYYIVAFVLNLLPGKAFSNMKFYDGFNSCLLAGLSQAKKLIVVNHPAVKTKLGNV